jgi:hypothetical protein|tara:strand:+ start:3797 stop:4255 length:459 start_codon:yes stop_codon:yes gene_type:complete
MPLDTALNLLTDATMDEATDAPAGHTHINVQETAEVDALVSLGVSAAATAVDDTLQVNIEVSTDGGTTYFRAASFRLFTGVDVPDTTAESASVRGFKAAKRIRLPRADSGQGGLLRVRALTDATITSTGDFNLSVDLVDSSNVRDVWYDNAA